jgi:excisionase family DNA binding protein
MNKASENAATLEWLDLRRLTGYAAVSERTLRAWIHSPVEPLPAVRVGAKILVRKSDFDHWLEQHAVKPLDLAAIVEEIVGAVTDGR